MKYALGSISSELVVPDTHSICPRGDWTIFFIIMKFSFFLLHCVPLYVCRLCINYQDLSATLLGVAALVCCFSPSLHALWLISCLLEKL